MIQDLANPDPKFEQRKHKLKRLVPGAKSYYIDIKCANCYKIQTVFSHASTVISCRECNTVLLRPTGGKAAINNGSQFRRK